MISSVADKNVTRIPMLERDQVPPELGSLYDVLLQQRGVIPNMFKTVANAPALAMGFAALLKPLLSDGALPGWYKELVATRISVLLGSALPVDATDLAMAAGPGADVSRYRVETIGQATYRILTRSTGSGVCGRSASAVG